MPLPAEVAADVRVMQHDVVARDAHGGGQVVADVLGHLRVGPDVRASALDRHYRGVRLQVRLVVALRLVLALDDDVGPGEAGVEVTSVVHRPPVRVGRLTPGSHARVRVEVGVQQGRLRLQRGVQVEGGRELLVGDIDQVGGVAGDLLGLRGHCGDALSRVAHDATREHRDVLDAAPVEVLSDVLAGDHRVHTRQGARLGGVDAEDARVRACAVDEPAGDRAGDRLVGHVARGTGDLRQPVDARRRPTELHVVRHAPILSHVETRVALSHPVPASAAQWGAE